jgi:hypothetical protein
VDGAVWLVGHLLASCAGLFLNETEK